MGSLSVIAALKAHVQYQLPSEFFDLVLMKRRLDGGAECTAEILDSNEFKGAIADCLRQIIIYPASLSEGGMSISKADKDSLLKEADRLYKEIGEKPLEKPEEKPKITCY